MELTFFERLLLGMWLAIIIRTIGDWWRSRYVIVKRVTMQDYANRDMDLTLSTLYPLKKEGNNVS